VTSSDNDVSSGRHSSLGSSTAAVVKWTRTHFGKRVFSVCNIDSYPAFRRARFIVLLLINIYFLYLRTLSVCTVGRVCMTGHDNTFYGRRHGHEAPGPVGPGSTRPRAVAVSGIRPGRPWPTQILAWTTQINFGPTVAGGLPKVIVHIF